MPVFKCTTRQAIGRAYAIPAGSSVEITISYSSTRPTVQEIAKAFETKYGVPVGTSELSAIDYQKIG